MKLCKDCEHLREPVVGSIAKCYHPSALINKDMVFGHHVYWSASAMRNSHDKNTCGSVAKYYEEKLTSAKPQ